MIGLLTPAPGTPLTPAETFLFPRTVTAYRETQDADGGFKPGYNAQARAEVEGTPIAGAVDLPASIQAQRGGGPNPPGLPTDTKRGDWFILVPERFVARGVVKQGDRLKDDLGSWYTVTADYWGPLGVRWTAWREEA